MKQLLDQLIHQYKFVLLYHDKKFTYLLLNHWRYVDPIREAARVKLYPNKTKKRGTEYFTY